MPTLLPKKGQPQAVVADDSVLATLAADPTVPDIPQGSSWGSVYTPQPPVQQTSGTWGSTAMAQSGNWGGQMGNMPNIPPAPLSNPELTAAAARTAANDADVLVANTNEHWVNTRWRPAMGWMYMAVCIFDFILFPIGYTIVQFWEIQAANDAFRQWQPITLQGGGLFHVAMGAVLGVAAYGRTKEKIEGKA